MIKLVYHDCAMADRNYASYLLRLRQIQTDMEILWIASMQSTATGETFPFPSAEALVRFLMAEYGKHQACDCAVEPTPAQLPPGGMFP